MKKGRAGTMTHDYRDCQVVNHPVTRRATCSMVVKAIVASCPRKAKTAKGEEPETD